MLQFLEPLARDEMRAVSAGELTMFLVVSRDRGTGHILRLYGERFERILLEIHDGSSRAYETG
jgi:hypothetical protein